MVSQRNAAAWRATVQYPGDEHLFISAFIFKFVPIPEQGRICPYIRSPSVYTKICARRHMSVIRLLLASDYEMTRDGIRGLLSSRAQDISVIAEAESVADAPATFRGLRADVILLEISAPGSTALRAVACLVRECPDARIVV